VVDEANYGRAHRQYSVPGKMSRTPPFPRYGTPREDSETAPLAATREAWYEERDLSDEVLPSYGEAIADRANTRQTTRAQRPAREQMVMATPGRRGSRTLKDISQKSLLNMSPCLLAPVIALIMGAIFRYSSHDKV
jgi:hypothetical protein